MTTAQITEILGVNNLDARVYIPEIDFISYGKDKNVTFSEIKENTKEEIKWKNLK